MKRKFALIIAVLGTLGILFTLIYHMFDNPSTPLASGLEIFRYFTILSNLIVAIYFWLLFSLNLDKNSLFKKLLGGVAVYITITGVVFALFLQADFQQFGLDKVGSIISHYIIPILTVGFLLFFREDYNFSFKDIIKWSIFPIGYIIFLLIRGSVTSDYIYPFLELDSLGFGLFTLYFIVLIAFFGILSIGVVCLTRIKK